MYCPKWHETRCLFVMSFNSNAVWCVMVMGLTDLWRIADSIVRSWTYIYPRVKNSNWGWVSFRVQENWDFSSKIFILKHSSIGFAIRWLIWLLNMAGLFLGGDELMGGGGGSVRTPPWYLSYGRSKLLKLISPKQIMSQSSIWALDQPPEMHSLLKSNLEVAEDHECDYCEMNFHNLQFLSYRHVIYIKKILRSYWLQIWNKKFHFLVKKYDFGPFL